MAICRGHYGKAGEDIAGEKEQERCGGHWQFAFVTAVLFLYLPADDRPAMRIKNILYFPIGLCSAQKFFRGLRSLKKRAMMGLS